MTGLLATLDSTLLHWRPAPVIVVGMGSNVSLYTYASTQGNKLEDNYEMTPWVSPDQILVIVVIASAPSDGSLEGAASPNVACLERLTAAVLNCNIDTLMNTQYWVKPPTNAFTLQTSDCKK